MSWGTKGSQSRVVMRKYMSLCTIFQRMWCSVSVLRSTIARIRGIICFPSSCNFSRILHEFCRRARGVNSIHGGPNRCAHTWPPPLYKQTSDCVMEWSRVWQPSNSSWLHQWLCVSCSRTVQTNKIGWGHTNCRAPNVECCHTHGHRLLLRKETTPENPHTEHTKLLKHPEP